MFPSSGRSLPWQVPLFRAHICPPSLSRPYSLCQVCRPRHAGGGVVRVRRCRWVLGGGVAVLTESTPIRCRAACSGAQCRHPRAGGRPVGCRAGAVCSPPNLPCSAKGACHAVPVGTLVGPALIPPPSPPVQSQLSTLQASGSAMAVGALQGILAQLKSLSNQIHGEHTPPGGRDGPHAHQSPS